MPIRKSSNLLAAASAAGIGTLGAVPLHASLVTPAGLAPGTPFVYIYETTATITGSSTNISDYNNLAASDAAAAGYGTYNGSPVTWGALVSTSTVTANTLIANDSTSFWTPGGTELATSYANLFGGAPLLNPISSDTGNVWTGSSSSGGPGTVGTKATTMGSSNGAEEGSPDSTTLWLDNSNSTGESNTFPIYAFSNELTATAVPEPMSLGLLGVAAMGLMARRRRSA